MVVPETSETIEKEVKKGNYDQLEHINSEFSAISETLKVILSKVSSDNTKEIARKYTDLVYDFKWCDDFSAARNFAFSKATKDYIYSADADEVIDDLNRRKFLELKKHQMIHLMMMTSKILLKRLVMKV